MRRDMDLIRKLLLDIEGEEKQDLSNYAEDQVNYHTYLLIDSGLVKGSVSRSRYAKGKFRIDRSSISYLTSKGHDFLDDARSETVWQQAKKAIGEKGATVSLGVFQALLSEIVKQGLLG